LFINQCSFKSQERPDNHRVSFREEHKGSQSALSTLSHARLLNPDMPGLTLYQDILHPHADEHDRDRCEEQRHDLRYGHDSPTSENVQNLRRGPERKPHNKEVYDE